MDTRLRVAEAVRAATIRPSLLQATVDTITAGIKLDEAEILARIAEHEAAEKKKETKGRKKEKKNRHSRHRRRVVIEGEPKLEDEDGRSETHKRTYRELDEGRFGLALPSPHHQFTTESERFIYPEAPPLDFSFTLISNTEEILMVPKQPQTRRSPKQPKKTADDRYFTSALRLSYNAIGSFDGFINTMYKILEPGPLGLCWLDLSYNNIDCLDEDTFIQLPNLRILYLHVNRVEDMLEVKKLRSCVCESFIFTYAHTSRKFSSNVINVSTSISVIGGTTFQGNSIEHDEAYRITILYYMPHLKKLDYFPVTKSDKADCSRLGARYEKHWAKKHFQIMQSTRDLKQELEKSLTVKMMAKALRS